MARVDMPSLFPLQKDDATDWGKVHRDCLARLEYLKSASSIGPQRGGFWRELIRACEALGEPAHIQELRLGYKTALQQGMTPEVVERLEFHDTWLDLADATDSQSLHFRPAYIHRWLLSESGAIGEGRTQNAILTIDECAPRLPQGPHRCQIASGTITTGSASYEELVPVPFSAAGPISLRIDLVDGTTIRLTGSHATIALIGTSSFVETLPTEFAPQGGA